VKDCRVECLKCHPLCETCDGPNSTNCFTCNLNLGAINLGAINFDGINLGAIPNAKGCSCPHRHYYDEATKSCLRCNDLCERCILGSSPTDCTHCASAAFQILDVHNKVVECVSLCDASKYYPDGNNRICKCTLIHLMN